MATVHPDFFQIWQKVRLFTLHIISDAMPRKAAALRVVPPRQKHTKGWIIAARQRTPAKRKAVKEDEPNREKHSAVISPQKKKRKRTVSLRRASTRSANKQENGKEFEELEEEEGDNDELKHSSKNKDDDEGEKEVEGNDNQFLNDNITAKASGVEQIQEQEERRRLCKQLKDLIGRALML